MQQPTPRRYQRNGHPGKGLTVTLPREVRSCVEALADVRHTSLAAVIVAILKQHFGLVTEDEEAA